MSKFKSSGPSQRMLRAGEVVRHAMAEFLSRGEILDPIIAGKAITVPEVRMTPDLKQAFVYVMPLGGGGAEDVAAALNRHRKFIRGRIAPVINLKYAPEVEFRVDQTFDEAGRIEALLRSERVQKDLRSDEDAPPED